MMLKIFIFVLVSTFYGMPAFSEGGQTAISPLLPGNHRLVFNQYKEDAELQWTLSSIKKINGRWRYDESAKTQGNMHKQTYEFDDIDRQSLTKKIEQLSLKKQWKTVFGCAGLACGRSYGWSEIFSNKALHGIDSSQRYWVWQTKSAWYSAFIVERGNRRVYLQWLELALTDETPLDTLAKNTLLIWENQGFALLPAQAQEGSQDKGGDAIPAEDIELLLRWLDAQPHREYAVVGHNQILRSSLSEQETHSLRDAQALLPVLKSALKDYSFKAYGLGPIAPRGSRQQRVEIVPLNKN